MGQIADDTIEGACCSLCGQYFEDGYEHGYPVVCTECWRDLTKEEKKDFQKATAETL